MTNYFPVYRNIVDWVILDEREIHDFTDKEVPILVVSVLIGSLHYEFLDFNKHYSTKRTPIIRWITKKQYEHLLQHEGEIIW